MSTPDPDEVSKGAEAMAFDGIKRDGENVVLDMELKV
jgi:hypothetical protein